MVKPALLAISASFFLCVVHLAYGIKEIKDDSTGGDCLAMGNWNPTAKICTLIRDLNEGIKISGNGITLVGNQHALTGNGAGSGVEISNQKDVTVLSLKVTNFHFGIHIRAGKDHQVEGSIITENKPVGAGIGLGIVLRDNHGSWIANNKIIDNDGMGVYVVRSHYGNITANEFKKNIDGIYLDRSTNNNIEKNELQGSGKGGANGIYLKDTSDSNTVIYNQVSNYQQGRGMSILESEDNIVMFNEFQSNQTSAIYVKAPNNRVVCNDMTNHGIQAVWLDQPAAGNTVVFNNLYNLDDANDLNPPNSNGFLHNYWKKNPNCPDANMDGRCDVPYMFPNNVDNVPLKDPVPWRTNPDMCRAGYGQPLRSWHPPFDVLRNLKQFGYSLQHEDDEGKP